MTKHFLYSKDQKHGKWHKNLQVIRKKKNLKISHKCPVTTSHTKRSAQKKKPTKKILKGKRKIIEIFFSSSVLDTQREPPTLCCFSSQFIFSRFMRKWTGWVVLSWNSLKGTESQNIHENYSPLIIQAGATTSNESLFVSVCIKKNGIQQKKRKKFFICELVSVLRIISHPHTNRSASFSCVQMMIVEI